MPRFVRAAPYQSDILALPISDLDSAEWYESHFGMKEVERVQEPPTVILERDGVRIGFCINGGDPTQDGASVLVQGIHELRNEFESRGIKIGNWRIDDHDGTDHQVFFIVAPDGLCYYFHEPKGS